MYAAVDGSTPTTHGPSSFDDWFAQHAGRQVAFSQPVAYNTSDGAYSLAMPAFWPIDGELTHEWSIGVVINAFGPA